jgi:hypothetical protein
MIKQLINSYGKDKINTLTKYPSILTLHKFGDRGRLTNEFTTDIQGEKMYATEKIDGTNARIICYGSEYLIGSREFILHHSHDLYFDNALDIVQGIKNLNINIPITDDFTVIYGEFYGGKVSSNSKWYGKDKIGFRIFDVAVYNDLSILNEPLHVISRWRERETSDGIIYGQNFLTRNEMINNFSTFEYVPIVDFYLGDYSHKTILDNLRKYIPHTNVALSDTATNKAEGIVLRNENRTKIIKLRFEDYERTLR